MIKPTLLNGGRMHGKSRLQAYENFKAEMKGLGISKPGHVASNKHRAMFSVDECPPTNPGLKAHLRKTSPIKAQMTSTIDLADSPNSSDVRAMAEMVNRQIHKAFNRNLLMGVGGVFPQYPRAPKTTVSVTIDRASPSGDKSVEVTIKDGVIVKTREL